VSYYRPPNLSVNALNDSIEDLAFSPDGKHLAAVYLHGSGVHVWNTSTGRLSASFESQFKDVSIGVHLQWLDSKRLLGIDGYGFFTCFNLDHARKSFSRHLNEDSFLQEKPAGVSPDGSRIALVGGMDSPSEIIDASDGSTLLELHEAGKGIFQICWSADGRWLLAAGTRVLVLDASTGSIIWEVPSTGDRHLHTIVISQDDLRFCVIGLDCTVWNLLRREKMFTLPLDGGNLIWSGPDSLFSAAGIPYFDPPGNRLVIHNKLLTSSFSWVVDVQSGALVETLNGALDPVAEADTRWLWRARGTKMGTHFENRDGIEFACGPAMSEIVVSPTQPIVAGTLMVSIDYLSASKFIFVYNVADKCSSVISVDT
jgi:WD40 repeat protein